MRSKISSKLVIASCTSHLHRSYYGLMTSFMQDVYLPYRWKQRQKLIAVGGLECRKRETGYIIMCYNTTILQYYIPGTYSSVHTILMASLLVFCFTSETMFSVYVLGIAFFLVFVCLACCVRCVLEPATSAFDLLYFSFGSFFFGPTLLSEFTTFPFYIVFLFL